MSYPAARGPMVALNPQYEYGTPEGGPCWDPRAAQRLSQCHRGVPKYLFRAWAPASGGDSRLNTRDRITPMAFLKDPSLEAAISGYPIEATMGQGEFIYQTSGHLEGYSDYDTRFSSWTMSFEFAVKYALVLEQKGSGFHSGNGLPIGGAHISVIDTEMLRHSNPAVYVPDIGYCVPEEEKTYKRFPWEYLVHGVVNNSAAHKAVSITELFSAGILDLYPEFAGQLDRNTWWASAGKLRYREIVPLTVPHIRNCTKVAAVFGSIFAPAVAIALASTRRRDESCFLSTAPDAAVLDELIKIYDGKLPDWSCRKIMENDVLGNEYRETWQFVALMRRLAVRNQLFGPGIVAAKKLAEEQKLANLRAVAEKIRLQYLPRQHELWRQSLSGFAVTPDLMPETSWAIEIEV